MEEISREQFNTHPLLARLLELHKPPEKIFIQGKLPSLTIDKNGRATPRIITVVGSRKHTHYAEDVIRTLISSLEGYPVVIISGLALGIDSLAHTYALKNNIQTIAIPGSGLNKNVLYPHANITLASNILKKDGVLMSECAPNQKASKWSFPSRNRLMAALSDVVLIIEATEKSGTLITARIALELGKDIGVIPGNIFSENAKGTNELARNGAYLITKKDDLFDLLHLSEIPKGDISTKEETIYSKEEKLILNILTEPLAKDILLTKTKLDPVAFLIALSSLEIKGCVQETFGEVRKVV